MREANQERSSNRALYKAFNKYGINNFKFEIIEETDNPNEQEKYYIQLFNTYHNGYNETLGGDGSSYLNLPENDICNFYLQTKSLNKTATHFNCDRKTVDNILYKHNIQKFKLTETLMTAASNKKAVAQLDKNTEEILHIYPSVGEAERQTKAGGHIKDVCHGKRKTAGGYKWKFI